LCGSARRHRRRHQTLNTTGFCQLLPRKIPTGTRDARHGAHPYTRASALSGTRRSLAPSKDQKLGARCWRPNRLCLPDTTPAPVPARLTGSRLTPPSGPLLFRLCGQRWWIRDVAPNGIGAPGGVRRITRPSPCTVRMRLARIILTRAVCTGCLDQAQLEIHPSNGWTRREAGGEA
jgi:hypothetical protein